MAENTAVSSDEQVNAVYWAFNECGSVREANRQLNEGLMSSVEHARYVLQVWEEHKRLPQHRDIVAAFPLMF